MDSVSKLSSDLLRPSSWASLQHNNDRSVQKRPASLMLTSLYYCICWQRLVLQWAPTTYPACAVSLHGRSAVLPWSLPGNEDENQTILGLFFSFFPLSPFFLSFSFSFYFSLSRFLSFLLL